MREDRRYKLESFARGPALLSDSVRPIPRQLWLYKARNDRWNIHEIILHLADSEANAYIQCRYLIAEPDAPAINFDAARWASTLGYFHQSARDAMDLIRRLRRVTYQLLRTASPLVWEKGGIEEHLSKPSLDEWLAIRERHIPHHIEQIDELFDEWKKKSQKTRSIPSDSTMAVRTTM
jgi:hypothetical protein